MDSPNSDLEDRTAVPKAARKADKSPAGDVHAPLDEVFKRLVAWQEEQEKQQGRMTAAQMAADLGFTRGTLGSYLTHYADVMGKRLKPSASARAFRFTKLDPEIQARIADRLQTPIDQLRSLSMGEKEPADAMVPEAATAVNAIGNRSALPEFTKPGLLRFVVARAAETVPGVGAVAVVSEYRGDAFRFLDQHQIAVFAEPGSDVAGLRDLISEQLDRLSLPGSWEHGSKQPVATMAAGRVLEPIGSIVCPWVAAPRPPGAGLLVRIRGERFASHRIGAVVSGPYAGSVPVGSYLSGALAAGYARFEDLVRLANAQVERASGLSADEPSESLRSTTRSARTALAERQHDINAGFLGHQALIAMTSGDVAGAWVTAMEVSPLDVYPAIKKALVKLPDVVVVLHYGPSWQRMAAWRMAATDLDIHAQSGEFEPGVSDEVKAAALREPPIYSSDTLRDVADGNPLSTSDDEADAIRAVLEHQTVVAARWYDQITGWEQALTEIEGLRRGNRKLTVSITLEELPADSLGYRFDGGRYRLQSADEGEAAGRVLYQDRLEQMVDAWVLAAAKVLHIFANLGGDSPADYLTTILPGPARDAVDFGDYARTGGFARVGDE